MKQIIFIFVLLASGQVLAGREDGRCSMTPDKISLLKGRLACRESSNVSACNELFGIKNSSTPDSLSARDAVGVGVGSTLGAGAGALTADGLWNRWQGSYLSEVNKIRFMYAHYELDDLFRSFLKDIMGVPETSIPKGDLLSKSTKSAFYKSPYLGQDGVQEYLERLQRQFPDRPWFIHTFGSKTIGANLARQFIQLADEYADERVRYEIGLKLRQKMGERRAKITQKVQKVLYRPIARRTAIAGGAVVGGAAVGGPIGAAAGVLAGAALTAADVISSEANATACPQLDGSATPFVSYSRECNPDYEFLEANVIDFLNQPTSEQQQVLNAMPIACEFYRGFYEKEVAPLAHSITSCRGSGALIEGRHRDGGDYSYEVQSLFPRTGHIRQVRVEKDGKLLGTLRFDPNGQVHHGDLSGAGYDLFSEVQVLTPSVHQCCYDNRDNPSDQMSCLDRLKDESSNSTETDTKGSSSAFRRLPNCGNELVTGTMEGEFERLRCTSS